MHDDRGTVTDVTARSTSERTAPLTIRLLGPVGIEVQGEPLDVDTRKAVALLAYVAVAGRPTPRESLAALLWPDSEEAEARGALRRTLSVLNAGLGRVGLIVDRHTVALDPEAVDFDLDRFRTAIRAARDHGHQPGTGCDACVRTLEAAVGSARGPFMEGFALRDSDVFDEWLFSERESHQRELAGALERLVREQLALGRWDPAIGHARRWSALDPLHEPAHRALMEAYARSGESAAAVQQYRDAAAVLDRELGVAPLPETTSLYEAVLAGSLVPPAADQPGLPDPTSTGAEPSAPPLLGRDDELDRLLALLDPPVRSGRLVAIEGEAGIGKTRLADAAAHARKHGRPIAAVRCYAGEAAIALAPIVGLLRARVAVAPDALPTHTRATLAALLPELQAGAVAASTAEATAGPAARFALFEAIAAGLLLGATEDEPAILRVDDLQWADDSTLDVLAFLARRLDGRPLILLLSWRREELDERAGPLMAELPGDGLIRLGRLDGEDVRSLVRALSQRTDAEPQTAEVDALVGEAEGLPLYVVEAMAARDRTPGSVPAGIRALLQARLAALSEVATQVVGAAAIIGRSFDLDVVRLVSGRSDDETVAALEELSRRGIVLEAAGESGSYDFAHARLRDVTLEDTSVARRRLLHRRTAAAYRALGDGRDHLGRLARIARHEREAGRSAEAAEAFEQAGQLARAVFANQEAVAYLEAAIALGYPDTAEIHLAIGEVRTRIGDYPGAIAALELAAADAAPPELAAIEQRVGRIHLRRGHLVAAEAHFTAGLRVLETAQGAHDDLRARILADQAVAVARAGAPARAAALAEEARDLAGSDAVAAVEADRILGLLARERGDGAEARRLLEQSLAGAERLDDPAAAVAAGNGLVLVAIDAGATDEAVARGTAALEVARRTGERHLEAALENNLADALEAAGRREDAMAHLKAAAIAFADVGGATDAPEPGIWMLESW
jgi:DNA-binding SARP family transcriptional activator